MSLTILLTGAAGRIGRAVCEALSNAGHEVRAVDRRYRRDLPVRLELVDLLDGRAVYRFVEGCDAVVHLANYPHQSRRIPAQQLYNENVSMDMNVFQAAADAGVPHLVFASSAQVFSGSRDADREDGLEQPSCLPYLPLDGDLPTCPASTYALSKEAGELQLRYFASIDPALACTVVRFPWILSPRHLGWFRRHAHGRQDEYLGRLDEGFTYLAAADAGSFVLAVVEHAEPGYRCFYPAAPDNRLGLPPADIVPRVYPGVPLRVPIESLTSLVDLAPLAAKLGWQPKEIGLFTGQADAESDQAES